MNLPIELKAALRGLAASAAPEPSLFATMAPTPDHLAADFDHWWRIVRQERFPLERAQARALQDVQEQLAAMSTGVDRRNWTEEAMRHSPAWDWVRLLAMAALEALGWAESEAPPEEPEG